MMLESQYNLGKHLDITEIFCDPISEIPYISYIKQRIRKIIVYYPKHSMYSKEYKYSSYIL